MKHKICQLNLSCALVAASVLFGLSSARAEVINLVCGSPGYYNNYWIDTASNTITVEGRAAAPAVNTVKYYVYPVQITRLTYKWFANPQAPELNWQYTIDRVSGRFTQYLQVGRDPPHFVNSHCSKGSTPMPAPKL